MMNFAACLPFLALTLVALPSCALPITESKALSIELNPRIKVIDRADLPKSQSDLGELPEWMRPSK